MYICEAFIPIIVFIWSLPYMYLKMDNKIIILIVSLITMAELTVSGIKMIYVHIVIIIFVPKKLSGKIFISVKNALSINKKSQGHILKRQLPEHAIIFKIFSNRILRTHITDT